MVAIATGNPENSTAPSWRTAEGGRPDVPSLSLAWRKPAIAKRRKKETCDQRKKINFEGARAKNAGEWISIPLLAVFVLLQYRTLSLVPLCLFPILGLWETYRRALSYSGPFPTTSTLHRCKLSATNWVSSCAPSPSRISTRSHSRFASHR